MNPLFTKEDLEFREKIKKAQELERFNNLQELALIEQRIRKSKREKKMIDHIIEAWEKSKKTIEQNIIKDNFHPCDYKAFVERVLRELNHYMPEYDTFDVKNITEIDDGSDQGTLLYIIPEDSYQPLKYWVIKISYGSCSVCDCLQNIQSINDKYNLTDQQVKDYMSLALHIVQELKEI